MNNSNPLDKVHRYIMHPKSTNIIHLNCKLPKKPPGNCSLGIIEGCHYPEMSSQRHIQENFTDFYKTKKSYLFSTSWTTGKRRRNSFQLIRSKEVSVVYSSAKLTILRSLNLLNLYKWTKLNIFTTESLGYYTLQVFRQVCGVKQY